MFLVEFNDEIWSMEFSESTNKSCTCKCPDCRKRLHHQCQNKFHAKIHQDIIDQFLAREQYRIDSR